MASRSTSSQGLQRQHADTQSPARVLGSPDDKSLGFVLISLCVARGQDPEAGTRSPGRVVSPDSREKSPSRFPDSF